MSQNLFFWMMRICPGGICHGGYLLWGYLSWGYLSGGFCPGGFCPDTQQYGDTALMFGALVDKLITVYNYAQVCMH